MRTDRIGPKLERLLAAGVVDEALTVGFDWQLAAFAHRNDSDAKLASDRRAENEPQRVNARDAIRADTAVELHEISDESVKRCRIREQRGDIVAIPACLPIDLVQVGAHLVRR